MKKQALSLRQETAQILLWTLFLCVLLQGIFLIVGVWSMSVLYGTLWGGTVACLHTLALAITLRRAAKLSPPSAKILLQRSLVLRTLGLFILTAIGARISALHPIAVLLPLFFPRVAVSFYTIRDRLCEKRSAP